MVDNAMNTKNRKFVEEINFRQFLNHLMKKQEYKYIRLLAISAVGISFVTMFYNSIAFSCILSLTQNCLIVLFAAKEAVRLNPSVSAMSKHKMGVFLGLLIGGFSALTTVLISNAKYYFGGMRELIYIVRDQSIPNLSLQDFIIGLTSQLYIFLILVFISIITGFFASMYYASPRKS